MYKRQLSDHVVISQIIGNIKCLIGFLVILQAYQCVTLSDLQSSDALPLPLPLHAGRVTTKAATQR